MTRLTRQADGGTLGHILVFTSMVEAKWQSADILFVDADRCCEALYYLMRRHAYAIEIL